tara:strand:- start:305 stop:493 length:189 start_codon:yes stop_codon:yes gene_type:complete
MKYKSTFEIKVSYFSDLHDDGLLASGEFEILPIAINDDDLKNKLYDLVDNFLIKYLEKKKGE